MFDPNVCICFRLVLKNLCKNPVNILHIVVHNMAVMGIKITRKMDCMWANITLEANQIVTQRARPNIQLSVSLKVQKQTSSQVCAKTCGTAWKLTSSLSHLQSFHQEGQDCIENCIIPVCEWGWHIFEYIFKNVNGFFQAFTSINLGWTASHHISLDYCLWMYEVHDYTNNKYIVIIK